MQVLLPHERQPVRRLVDRVSLRDGRVHRRMAGRHEVVDALPAKALAKHGAFGRVGGVERRAAEAAGGLELLGSGAMCEMSERRMADEQPEHTTSLA